MYNQKSIKTSKTWFPSLRVGLGWGFLLIPFLVQAQYPDPVETVLKKAGNNRIELEKAIEYCNKTGDSLKIKAMQFLIANMDIHSSSDYYWEDVAGKKIAYNELDYPDFEQAKTAFEAVKEKNPGLKPTPVIYKDIETITGDYLIQNLEKAFVAWRTSVIKTTSFVDFCEYILPYRVSVEPLQAWRTVYAEKFKWINQHIPSKGFKSVMYYPKDDSAFWFTNTWKDIRKEPLPRLGALQLLLRKEGPCPDVADLSVFILRSQGIPAAVNVIPFWATATGGHFISSFFDDTMQAFSYEYGAQYFGENLEREPAKVLRMTYSKQPQTLASFENKNNIPVGVLQQQNYIDVTKDYWETTSVKCALYPTTTASKIVYATTFNGLSWRPFWWGKVENGQTTFSSICKGTVLLPQYYSNGKLIPAGAPVVIGNTTTKTFLADLTQTSDVIIAEKEKYLKFKLGISYQLFYWDNGWKTLGKQAVNTPITEMKFEKVPKNALLLFLASDSKGLERPFIMDENGERNWF